MEFRSLNLKSFSTYHEKNINVQNEVKIDLFLAFNNNRVETRSVDQPTHDNCVSLSVIEFSDVNLKERFNYGQNNPFKTRMLS